MKYTDRLMFKTPNQEDFQRYFEINADPQTNLYNPYGAMSFEKAKSTFDALTDHWREHQFGFWAISEKENPDWVIGFGGLNYRLYGHVVKLNLGYRIDKDFWNKGYATEIGMHTIQYGFEELGQNQIFAVVRPDNLASIKVLEKCGLELFDELNDIPNQKNSLIFKIQKNIE
ncbi:GNAT family N-acetyltransferase [Chryseobacterium lactis]|uniref:GNAT family N-acetyltransferase n=1 Tax=Chryseobacterium lactis TaxID=1241981 RepID=UPI001627765A|nr:GNAT family N-acetyltransferase [Chryseobacterium lactis]